nr:hypothetical protein [Planctomycetota bacterium]
PLEDPTEGGSSKIIPDKYKSGLLVVLDDDQEMPQSEKFERKTGSNTKSSSSLKVENFDEDDKGTDLPELPKI